MSERTHSDAAVLARLGFTSPDAVVLAGAVGIPAEVIAEGADPDQALELLAALIHAAPEVNEELQDETFARRLVAVLGASRALGEHLTLFPEDRRFLLADPNPVGLISAAGETWAQSLSTLRRSYRQSLLSTAAADLTGEITMPVVGRTLSLTADLVLQQALQLAAREHPGAASVVTLSVIAMGKCGGQELNYISDVDVIFVAEPLGQTPTDVAMRSGNLLASTMMKVCSEAGIWPVDAGLRPEGKDGPLVRTLDSHREYYKKWAKTWEFQALLKARHAAGDSTLGQAYLETLMPLVWSAADRDDFVVDVQAMRKRVEEHIPDKEAGRQIKLGVGGLRDVEFAVQLLQLVHGKADESLRTGNTLEALTSLSRGGFVGREDATALSDAYIWLRTVEHRLQLAKLRRTHVLPEDDASLRALGRSLGYHTDSAERLLGQWRDQASLIRRIHEKLFYRPLLQAVAKLGADEQRLTPEAAKRRLLALGYVDPQGALGHLEALTTGIARRAAIQRALLPAMLGWFADGPDPDAGLFGFRQLSERLGDTPWYLRTLRDSGVAAQRLALILSTSRFATELLLRAPEAAAMLEDNAQLTPRGREALVHEARAVAARYSDPEQAIEAVRAVRRRELFRTAVADVLGIIDVEEVGRALSDVAAATLWAALDAASNDVDSQLTDFAIIAMGRLGGDEMSYPSDADVLFVHRPREGVDEKSATDVAMHLASSMRSLCALPSPEPPLLIDADLRPEGRDGPLVRTLASYAAYYDSWSEGWERQALLRALPIAGDLQLGHDFVALIDPYRYLPGGVSATEIREIRRIKARVESERLPRGADPARHVKLGPGGLSDVEWLAQLLQLRFGSAHPALQSPSTLQVLRQSERLGLITASDLKSLVGAWSFATRIRNAVMLVRGKPSDELPRDPRDLRAVAHVLGFDTGGELIEEWQRSSRRARQTFEALFFSDTD